VALVVIIINPVSGGGRDQGRERAARARTALQAINQRPEIYISERRGHARELAAAAVARGATLVCAWGGDGTMNEVGSALVNTPAALALIPSGSGNGLARTLGVSLDPIRAMSDACRATPRAIDAGQCNDDWFFSVAGVGFDAYVAAGFERAGATRRGLFTYIRVAAWGLVGYVPRSYIVDGVRTGRPALLVTVANAAQFGNGAWIAPDARVDDGQLDLVIAEERSRFASLRAVPRLFTKTIGRAAGVSTRSVTHVTIEDDEPIPYHVDGEPRPGSRRLDMTVRPAVLRISVR